MRTALVPVLLVVVLPGLLVLDRTGLLRRRRVRIAAWIAGAALVALSLPWGGLPLDDRKWLLMLLAAAGAAVAALWGAGAWSRDRAVRWLAAVTVLAAATAVNFLGFHGGGAWVHVHDVAHYYLGAKYFDEIGHDGLYVAALRAEAEVYGDRFRSLTARDLATDRLVDIRVLLRASDPVKARFGEDRWAAFRADVAFFRDRLGPQWGRFLTDHGYNATPPLTTLARALAGLVPAGSARGVLLLTLLDPLLVAAALALAWWGFGRTGALLAALYLAVLFGAGFAWTGGAFLRFGWWAAFVAALACLARERWFAAGAALAVAAALRLHPAAFALGVAFHGLWAARAEGRLPRRHLRFAAGFLLALALLVGSTLALPDPGAAWRGFGERISLQTGTLSPNLVGVTQLLAWHRGPAEVTADELDELRERRRTIHRRQLVVALPLVLALCAWWARRLDPVEASMLGIPLLLATVNLASYDLILLVGLVLSRRKAPRDVALLLAVEAACYLLLLFADRDAAVYALRTVMVLTATALVLAAPAYSPGATEGRPK